MSTILTRVTNDNRPIIFMLDSLDKVNGTVQAWRPDTDEIEASNITKYKTTHAPSDQDEIAMADLYVKKFGLGENFTIRRKMFRHTPTTLSMTLNNGKDAPAIVTEGKADNTPKPAVEDTNTVESGLPRICIPEEKTEQDELIDKMMAAFAKALRETFK